MPSFDIVSEFEMHEAVNAVDQANREVNTRFDFKGSSAKFEQNKEVITMTAEAEFQLQQMYDILQTRLNRRGIDIACLQLGEVEKLGKQVKQSVTLRQGLESDLARKIVKMIKDKKLKVQSAIQGDKVRVTGKKRDDLQSVIAMLKEAKIDMPMQFNNFRD
ncbi:MAG TPA: YajQ family cyclic di-GMP-binding protein [Gammaproteobacteria bacterium]|nr:YajQ family cyclic di-GMP-binding protein [Gammaproteobacteria bacterium]